MTGASAGQGGAHSLGHDVPAVGRTEVWPQAQPAAAPVKVGTSATSFEQFYDREMPRLVALAQALAGPAVADDLAQEAMIVAFRKWDQVSTYDHPEAWVRRVCANTAVSMVRRRAAEARALLKLGSRPEPAALDPATETFWDEVRRLPRRQAQAIALRYLYDLQVDDIAQTMGCSAGSVKVHLNRARTTLAARLATTEEEWT